ncbi:hypothetical protein P154DRAFT_517607 [Amniculicola lignicola CBS 123094]|uniref:Uncharacterized protein n=1 Tax=Amniculicola lignicola CBS 123094 TaxID=1392246 RepID=A0A6A5X187_9PLEO|nr:hypothetical protein P154DRAFT_517607 [Amniculicola lignicola CBS 123094]
MNAKRIREPVPEPDSKSTRVPEPKSRSTVPKPQSESAPQSGLLRRDRGQGEQQHAIKSLPRLAEETF